MSRLIRAMHPYARVWVAVVLAVGAALAATPVRLGFAALAVGVWAHAARVPARRLALGLVPVISLVVWLVAMGIVSGTRPADLRLEPMAVFAGRCWVVFAAFAGLGVLASATDAVGAMEAVRAPVLLTATAGSILRWVDLLAAEARRLNTARTLRGGDSCGLRARVRSVGAMCVSMMVRSYRRAERVADAMDCRGFPGRLLRLTRDGGASLRDILAPVTAAAYFTLVWVATR